MITVGIAGILASLAIPTFSRYKARAYTAEAHTHLGSMVTGIKSYYQQDHWSQGTVASGTTSDATNCIPKTALTSNMPASLTKTVLNWDSESESFRAIGFAPPEALLFSYRMGDATPFTPGGPGFYTLGSNDVGECGISRNDDNVYHVEASITPDGAKYHFMRWRLCSNADNSLFMCERAQNDFECAVAPGSGGDPRTAWTLIVIGAGLAMRRRRRSART